MKVARNAFWLSFCRVVADLSSFALFAVISRAAGPAGIGEYAYAFAIGGLVSLISTSGFEELGIRQYAQLPGQQRLDAWRNILSAQALQLALGLLLLGMFLLWGKPEQVRMSVVLELTVFLVGWGLARTFFIPAMATESMVKPAMAELGCRLVPLGVALLLALTTTASLPLLLLGYPIGSAMLVWASLRNAAQHGAPLTLGREWPGTRSALWGAAPFTASATLNQFYARTDLILIAYLLGTAQAGLYATDIKFIEVGNVPLVLLGTAAYPLLSKVVGEREKFGGLSRDLIRTTFFLSGWLATGVAFLVPLLIVPLFGADFGPARESLVWFALLTLAKGGEVALYRVMYAALRQGTYCLSLCIATLLMVILNFVLVPKFGILGAVTSGIASTTVVNCICALALRREVPLRVLAPIVARLAVALAITACLVVTVQRTGIAAWLIAGIACIAYPVIGFVVGLLPHPRRSKLFVPDVARPTH